MLNHFLVFFVISSLVSLFGFNGFLKHFESSIQFELDLFINPWGGHASVIIKYRRTCIKERGNKVATSNNKKVLIDFFYQLQGLKTRLPCLFSMKTLRLTNILMTS